MLPLSRAAYKCIARAPRSSFDSLAFNTTLRIARKPAVLLDRSFVCLFHFASFSFFDSPMRENIESPATLAGHFALLPSVWRNPCSPPTPPTYPHPTCYLVAPPPARDSPLGGRGVRHCRCVVRLSRTSRESNAFFHHIGPVFSRIPCGIDKFITLSYILPF